MLVWAKSSNYPLAAVLAPFALYLGWRAKNTRLAGTVGACGIAAFAILTMSTRPKPMQQATTYNAIFMAILPESPTPAADLQELGLDPKLVSFSGTGAWTPSTAFPQLYDRDLVHNVTGATVARFYLRHPTRIWRRAKSLLPAAFSLRPEWCGNFESSAGRPQGAKTQASHSGAHFTNAFWLPVGRFSSDRSRDLPVARHRFPRPYPSSSRICSRVKRLCPDRLPHGRHRRRLGQR